MTETRTREHDERGRAVPAYQERGMPQPRGGTTERTGVKAAPSALAPRPIPPLPPPVMTRGGPASGGERTGAAGAVPGTVSPSGTGQDARHRGWYWHWNTLVTQYAPLLGLKGIGLLNSYTVWTDRRDGSPHQGYAFPAQESEARFYGEGREELITLNKVLVALDLIEIHKEMVVRQDERGRKWRVPHNFYKVQDPKDGLVLGLPAVVRLLELANRDRNVFRHIRHIFGPQFAPIDRTSHWHTLLPELRALPLWQDLEARAARERRTPRTGTQKPAGAETLPSSPTNAPTAPTIVSMSDNGMDITAPVADTESAFGTKHAPTIPFGRDIPPSVPTVVPLTRIAPPRYPIVVPPTGNAFPQLPLSNASNEPSRSIIGSTSDEGTMSVEDAIGRSVVHADSMYYQSGETKEETTSTSTTSARVHADAGARTRGEPADAPTDTPPLPTPLRPSVSDLFAALEAQRAHELPTGAVSPEAPDGWDTPPTPDTVEPPADDDTHDPPLDAADAGCRQPLPPDPGEPADLAEGPIIVRAVAVTDQPAIGTEARALLADIESALTMANGRPPSDMEMSLYWQIAQDCDPAASVGPGPGSGLGWVRAAITEAVYSGGTNRIAPKYIARICERWTAEGYMSDGRAAPTTAATVPAAPPEWPLLPTTRHEPDPPSGHTAGDTAPPAPVATAVSDADLARLWPGVIRRLEGILPADSLRAPWFTEARVIAVEGTRAVVQTIDSTTALKLTNYRGLISRRLSDALGWSVEAIFQAAPQPPSDPTETDGADDAPLAPSDGTTDAVMSADAPSGESSPLQQTSTRVNPLASPEASTPSVMPTSPGHLPAALASSITPSSGSAPAGATRHATMGSGPMPIVSHAGSQPASIPAHAVSRAQPRTAAPPPSPITSPSVPTFIVAGTGETNRDVWLRVLVRLREGISDVTFKVWLEPTALLAVEADGTYVIGTRNRVQRERLERQHTEDIAAALGAYLTQSVQVRFTVIGE